MNPSGSSGLHDGGEERAESLTPEQAEKWRRWERLHAERLRLAGELRTAADSRDPGDDHGPGPVVPAGPPPGDATLRAPQSPQVASRRAPVPDSDPAAAPGVPASVGSATAERLRAEVMRLEEELRSLKEERQQLSTERSRLEQARAEAVRAAAEAAAEAASAAAAEAAAEAAGEAAEASRSTQDLQGVAQRRESLPEAGPGRRSWRLPWMPRSEPPG